jgi:hypothetical protein
MKKKALKFSKGIIMIKFPIMLNNWTPWQDQITDEMKKISSQYKERNGVAWGFEISSVGAEINVSKLNKGI